MPLPAHLTANLQLARQIEAAHAASTATCVDPAKGGATETVAGGSAVFAGEGSPVSQAVGIGMHGPVSSDAMDRLEQFYSSRKTPCVIDLCSLADPTVLQLACERGYQLREVSYVLVRELQPRGVPTPPSGIRIGAVASTDLLAWARVVAEGFTESSVVTPEFLSMVSVSAAASHCFLARIHSTPASAAALGIHEDIATFYGDATPAAHRNRGLQRLLIEHRLAYAAAHGCRLATASVLPGSASHRNYLRAGFEFLSVRTQLVRTF